ncbi:hypothetical protein ANCDUO_06861 [Ancylostoma duodenale]|uniref:Uncharacterized protein n=1 Tax=Ancylostoma duodenale TaxID=51022 RepID=A0A0C2GV39_9BILA|nr:hypothetical protein ANCDUO_06861 [Ancylostoma duodenale]
MMVWAGITYTGKAPLIFVHEGVKVQGPQEEMWTYQQDGAPSEESPKKRMNGLRETFRTSPRWTYVLNGLATGQQIHLVWTL